MKEEWLFHGAVVPIDVETTAALVAEIKRLIDVIGGLILNQGPHYERGFIDGMQKQMQSSVDKAVNTMSQRTWVGLTDEEILDVNISTVTKVIDEPIVCDTDHNIIQLAKAIEAKLKEKNNG